MSGEPTPEIDPNASTLGRESMRLVDWIILTGMVVLTGLWAILLVVVVCSLWELLRGI